MPKPMFILTATRRDGEPISPWSKSPTTSISVYDQADLDRRLKEAENHPEITVTYRKA